MRVVGILDGTGAVFDAPLGHGDHPEVIAYEHGFSLRRPIDAQRTARGELVVRWSVMPEPGGRRPEVPPRGQDPGLDLDGIVPVPRQRIAAYAVVVSERGLLATEYSYRTAVPGRWGMPGGGIDDTEQPAAAVLREVAEETDQTVLLGPLAAVQTAHWVGRSPAGVVQDFHAVRLAYRASCAHPTDPRVVDTDGTTAAARWVPLRVWPELAWTSGWRALLSELLAGR